MKSNRFRFPLFVAIVIAMVYPWQPAGSYPIDGFALTGIERLVRLTKMDSSTLVRTLPYGARYELEYVRLNLMDDPILELPEVDAELQAEISQIFPNMHPSYSVAVFDMSEGRPNRYAERNPTAGYQPGSVGKLAVVTAFFCELQNLYPEDYEARWELMRKKVVKAGPFGVYDHHTIPLYDTASERYARKRVDQSDEFNLYQWVDHMLSVSNNGAASIVWREALLMRAFGKDYPDLGYNDMMTYFDTIDRSRLRDLGEDIVNGPLRDLGIDGDAWRLGTMFTRGASGIVPPKGGSNGTVRGLMQWLTALESGRVADPASSLEIKRLMYMTDRRIRYAHAPVLDSAAVYFKSGSLYGCKPGTSCGKYRGNRMNYMNSVAIVEQPDGTRYMVALMSNVLGRNSAYDHQVLATRIDKVVRKTAAEDPSESIGTGE
ncbi:hypothetical protein LEM8419_02939 [Neolewinella maritima]|uniref:Beta-lactamase class A catalytic domain-containing protein n=1 Tax=Neolewinella maritima TaxID=1383882 RepID=A0ABN8FCL7_9BACT|nr:serine hydrolase [Neolewinella maritima]CAH1002024.1 hypothetical protein LEM8419_02939 [Neolewinella maritima]